MTDDFGLNIIVAMYFFSLPIMIGLLLIMYSQPRHGKWEWNWIKFKWEKDDSRRNT